MELQETTEKTIRDASRKIAEKFQPEKIILFGSWAWGTPGPDSDVDLFVVKETENTRHMAREIDGFMYPRPFPLDVTVYTPEGIERSLRSGNFFIRDILQNGTVLYEKRA